MRRFLLLLAVILPSAPLPAQEIEALRRTYSRGGEYKAPKAKELEAARDLFIATLRAEAVSRELRKKWTDLGFRAVEGGRGNDRWIAIVETDSRREGRGFFAVRPGRSLPVLVQAPHSFQDLYTGEIVAVMFEESRFAAAAWNSVPRRRRGEGKWGEADLAHTDESFFMEFLKAFVACHLTGTIVQIHGFDRTRRKTRAAREASVIISDGTRHPGCRLTARKDCLHALLRSKVGLYPQEVAELGGTMNRQGHWLRQNGCGFFIHVELGLKTREILREEEEMCARLGLCLSRD